MPMSNTVAAKRKRMIAACDKFATSPSDPAPNEERDSTSTDTTDLSVISESGCATTVSSYKNISSNEDEDETERDSKPASVNTNKDKDKRHTTDTPTATTTAAVAAQNNPFLMLGSDVMVMVVGFLEPRETLTLLTLPLCKEWRLSYTADQDLWRTVCRKEPFAADLSTYGACIDEASTSTNTNTNTNTNSDDEDNSFRSLDDYKDSFENKNVLVGEYRLIYTSFVRCMKYLDLVQNSNNTDRLEDKTNSSPGDNKENKSSHHGNRFPTFGVTKSLKSFLSRSKERGVLKSVIGNGTSGEIPSAPVQDSFSKKPIKEEDNSKPKYAQSMITARLWGPTATGVPSHLNLPKSCAIYSIVNWMVAHPYVRGIQTMCIQALPSLLEDEQQRLTGRRVGLVEVILCAMLRFPESVELHIAVFHAIVLLARPLGGREGMLFSNSMSQSTQNIGLTSIISLSDPVTLAARCGGHPSLDGKANKHNSRTTNTSAGNDSSSDIAKEKGSQTGISILVESMERFSYSEKLQSMACWALVNVALVPLQKNMLMKVGGVDAILSAMENHSTSFNVQFRALFALINLVVPCRQSDFVRNPFIDAAAATHMETVVLNRLGPKIAKLSISAMKNFWSNETILNRGCLVVHNLSQSPEFVATLLETVDCCQILEHCATHHATDRVLGRSVKITLQRMQTYLDRHPQERERFTESMLAQTPIGRA